MDTKPLTEDKLVSKTDPFCQFDSWLKDATQMDHHFALNACLATGAQDGTISNRVVTMGSFNKDGFVFFTSAEGRKAKELESNPNCALTFLLAHIMAASPYRGNSQSASGRTQ
eukprot:Em0006g1136a